MTVEAWRYVTEVPFSVQSLRVRTSGQRGERGRARMETRSKPELIELTFRASHAPAPSRGSTQSESCESMCGVSGCNEV